MILNDIFQRFALILRISPESRSKRALFNVLSKTTLPSSRRPAIYTAFVKRKSVGLDWYRYPHNVRLEPTAVQSASRIRLAETLEMVIVSCALGGLWKDGSRKSWCAAMMWSMDKESLQPANRLAKAESENDLTSATERTG